MTAVQRDLKKVKKKLKKNRSISNNCCTFGAEIIFYLNKSFNQFG